MAPSFVTAQLSHSRGLALMVSMNSLSHLVHILRFVGLDVGKAFRACPYVQRIVDAGRRNDPDGRKGKGQNDKREKESRRE